MVKRIQLTLDDEVFERLKEMKGDKSWEEFLVEPLIRDSEGFPYKREEERPGV